VSSRRARYLSLSSESRCLSNEFGEGERLGIVGEEVADVTEGESELGQNASEVASLGANLLAD
jgi:hypothetical protein